MNCVDLADQGRAECPTKRRTCLTWKPCFSFMFDTSVCNMAKLYEACGNYNKRHKKGLNSTFRRLLASKLMVKVAARAYKLTPGIKPGGNRTVLSDVVANACESSQPCTQTSSQVGEASQNTEHYGVLVKGEKQDTCKACQASRRYALKRRRVTLGEVSANATKPRAPRTDFQCNQCLIGLCKADLCWEEHLAAYLCKS